MRILCRSDASVKIGTGHVVRCATLTRYLANDGHEVKFVCREVPGNLNNWLEAQGLQVARLEQPADTEGEDASASMRAAGQLRYDWAIVDHYDLGPVWERAMSDVADRIL